MALRSRTALIIALACSMGLHGVLVWIVPPNTLLLSSRSSPETVELIVVDRLPQTLQDFSIPGVSTAPPIGSNTTPRSSTISRQPVSGNERVFRSTRSPGKDQSDADDEPTEASTHSSAPFASDGKNAVGSPSVDLSPRAAALTVVEGLSSGCRPSESTVRSEARGEDNADRLQSYLSHVAKDRPYLKRRDAPKLRHQTDGSYRFEGHAFDARIERDGTVRFTDRSKSGNFDITDAVEKYLLDNEIYTYEKRRFLKETAEQRERLARAYRSTFDAKSKRRLLGRLILIKEDTSKPKAAKHKQIFALWDDCSGGPIGRQAQELIERFIRAEMPKESALGFSQEEINAFNRRRVSQRVFTPYEAQPSRTAVQIRG